MIPAIEERGVGWEANEFLSTQIPSHFLFSLNFFFFESQVPKPVPYYAVQTRTDGEKLCWKGLWRATEKRNMTTQCVTHQLAAATSPSPQELRMEAARGAQKEQAHCRRGGCVQLENVGCACAALKIGIKSGAAAQPAKEKSIPRLACKMLSCTPSDPTWEPGIGTPQPVSLKEWPLHISTPPFRSRCI